MMMMMMVMVMMMMVSQNAHADDVDDHVVDDGDVGDVVEAGIEPTLKPTVERP